MGLARLDVLFFYVLVQELRFLREIHAFLPPVLFLMQVALEADHLRLQNRQCGLDEQEVYHLHLRPVLVCELDVLIFAAIKQKLHVSSGVRSNIVCPLWSIRLEKSTSQKLDM